MLWMQYLVGDGGASLQDVMTAATTAGICSEQLCPRQGFTSGEQRGQFFFSGRRIRARRSRGRQQRGRGGGNETRGVAARARRPG